MNKTRIVINKRKVIATGASDEFVNILLIVFIIDEFIGGKTKNTSLDQVAFIYDVVIKNKPVDNLFVKLTTPWAIPKNYRELIIMGSEKGYIQIIKKDSDVALSLGNEGVALIKTITEENLFSSYRIKVSKTVKAFKKVDLSLQNIIWS